MTSSLSGISSMATRLVLAELARHYESQSGCRVAIESVGGVDAARQVRAGAELDLIILASEVMAQLETEQLVVAGSRADFVRSEMAIAVGEGALRPPIQDEASVKQALLDARAIGYSTGPSGDHLKRLWEQWGIADEVSQKAVQANPGVSVATLIARGDVDLGFQQLSEFVGAQGIEVLGPMPLAIQAVTNFTVGIASTSRSAGQAHAFIDFLIAPEAGAVKVRHGLLPI